MRLVIRRLKNFNAVEETTARPAQIIPKKSYILDLENQHVAMAQNAVRAYGDTPITDIQIIHRAAGQADAQTDEEKALIGQGYIAVPYRCPTSSQQGQSVDVNMWSDCPEYASRMRFYIQRDTKNADPLVALSLLPFESAFVFKDSQYVNVAADTSVLGMRAPLGSARQIQVGHPFAEGCEIDDLITETSFESATWAATFCENAVGAFEAITSPVTDLFNVMPQALQDRAFTAGGGEAAARERLAVADSAAATKIIAYMNDHKTDRSSNAIQLHSFELVCRNLPKKLVWKRLLTSPFILYEDAAPHLLALQPFLWTLRRLNVPPLPDTAVLAQRSLVFGKELDECQEELRQAQQSATATNEQKRSDQSSKKLVAETVRGRQMAAAQAQRQRQRQQPQQIGGAAAPHTSPEQLQRQTLELQCERVTLRLTAAATAAAAQCDLDKSRLQQAKQSADTLAQECATAKQALVTSAATATTQCDAAKSRLEQAKQSAEQALVTSAATAATQCDADKSRLEQAKHSAEVLAQQCDAAKGQLQQQMRDKDAAAAAQRLPPALQSWPSFRDALRDAQIVNKKPVGADRTVKLFGAHVTSISLTADCTQLQWTSDS